MNTKKAGPMALASDPMGKVFASYLIDDELEVVEDNDKTISIVQDFEPSEVRQVWIASRVAGTNDKISIRSFQGKLLSCDQVGILSATREAISPQEEFTLVLFKEEGEEKEKEKPKPKPKKFGLRTVYGKFVSLEFDKEGNPQARADSELLGVNETWSVRIQERNRNKSDSKLSGMGVIKGSHISRRELESRAGRKLTLEEATKLKTAWKNGSINEAVLDLRVKTSRHDKFG